MPKIKKLLLCGFLVFVAALVAVYGADFTWRQILVGGLAVLIFQFADHQFVAAFTGRPFIRYQFGISLTNLGGALKAAGLYTDELPAATSSIYQSMIGKGGIVFAWLEPELFFINTTNQFGAHLEFFIDLPAQGSRNSEKLLELSDILEMRMTGEAYGCC